MEDKNKKIYTIDDIARELGSVKPLYPGQYPEKAVLVRRPDSGFLNLLKNMITGPTFLPGDWHSGKHIILPYFCQKIMLPQNFRFLKIALMESVKWQRKMTMISLYP